MSTPIDKELYEKIKKEAKKKYKVWSAYASAWLVSEYKKRGGKYRKQKNKTSKNKISGLKKWFQENWINVCKLPKIVKCGRKKSDKKNYPYCRPMYRIDSKSPKTVGELNKKQIKKKCEEKQKIIDLNLKKNVSKNSYGDFLFFGEKKIQKSKKIKSNKRSKKIEKK